MIKQLLIEQVFSLFKKIRVILIPFFLVLMTGVSTSESMLCAIPMYEGTEQIPSDTYIKLAESTTLIEFDITNRISKFSTPGCHKTQTVALWTNSVEISCNSNSGHSVNLKINLKTLRFDKTYSENKKTSRYFHGFCVRQTK